MRPIARVRTDFGTKFGCPRQSGLVGGLRGRVVFEPEFRDASALRGLEGFSHVWLLWDFSLARRAEGWRPTVRPPRLGGNRRVGVFATRSPFRPNGIGLSSVRLVAIHPSTPDGPQLEVEGADMADGTPVWDIKPYLPFTDCHPGATGGYAERALREERPLEAWMPPEVRAGLGKELSGALRGVLEADPRPSYQDNPGRVYRMTFAGREVSFRVEDGRAEVLSVSAPTGGRP